MPTYQYQCKNCGHELEELQSMTEAPLIHCPNCNTDNLVRVIGGGAGLIFKGTGFYLTDYKKESSKPAAPADKKQDKPSEKKETPTSNESRQSDTKDAAKAKPKPE